MSSILDLRELIKQRAAASHFLQAYLLKHAVEFCTNCAHLQTAACNYPYLKNNLVARQSI